MHACWVNENNIWLGRYGEDRACEYLDRLGYQILQRNARNKAGEIDIIATDQGTLVFVEVKTRTTTGAGHPFQAITSGKLARIRRVAAQWCSANQVHNAQVRFDAIGVIVSGGRVSVEHLKQVH